MIEMSENISKVRFAGYIDREGVFCPCVLLPKELFLPNAIQDIRPGMPLAMTVDELVLAVGDIEAGVEIFARMDQLDGHGRWIGFAETLMAIGAEVYRRTQEAKG